MDWIQEMYERDTMEELQARYERLLLAHRKLHNFSRAKERAMRDEINWLHAELHGAELKAGLYDPKDRL